MRNSYWIEKFCLQAKYFFFLKIKRKKRWPFSKMLVDFDRIW